MTLWQRFFKAIGGLGPDDPEDVPRWAVAESRESLLPEFHGPSEIARFLMWLGLLAYDPEIPDWKRGYFYNMKWQWAFWKGPYYDYVVQNRHLPGHNIKMRWVRSRAPWDDI